MAASSPGGGVAKRAREYCRRTSNRNPYPTRKLGFWPAERSVWWILAKSQTPLAASAIAFPRCVLPLPDDGRNLGTDKSTSDVTEGFYAGNRTRLVYGVFTTPVNSIGGSAICAFSMNSVLEVFQGAFKEQETINSNWLRVPAERVPKPRPGACVNDSRTLPDMTVNFVKAHPLMDDAVQSYFAMPVITKVSFNYRFTKVAVDSQVKALDGKAYDILYVGTDDGRVLKALNTRSPDSVTDVNQVIVSDVQVLKYGQAVKDLLVVHLAGEASKLVVFADSEIRAVPLHHCDSPLAGSCAACVALQDPHCAWDATTNLCVAVPTKLHDSDADKTLFQDILMGKHKGCGFEQEMAKPVQPAVPPEIGRGEQPDERDNEIVIELDRENQYGRTQPRANEPQGVIVTPVVYSAQTLTGALIGTCLFSLVAGFASGFWFSQRLRGTPYPEPSEQRQQLNRLTESSESPGFNNKSINLVLNVPPKNPNGKNANSSAENKPVQKDPTDFGTSSSSFDLAESDDRNDDEEEEEDEEEEDDDDDNDGINVDYDEDDECNEEKNDRRKEERKNIKEELASYCIPNQRSSISSDIVESYDNKNEPWVPLEFLLSSSKETTDLFDARYHPYQQSHNHRVVPRQESRGGPLRSGRGGGEGQELHYIETVISTNPNNCPRKRSDSNSSSNSSSSAMTTISTNSNDLLRKLRRNSATTNSTFVFDLAQTSDPSNPRDHYMVPTRNPRELNERILSLFNPQFLPNFNDMVKYMAASQQEPSNSRTNSRSINAETRLFRHTNRRRKRNSINDSMLFRQGLVYQVPRDK
uniref:Sema domain-containing protein n=1 Tax=Vespula pensylvanica TaxID=30213 RepID=A0A834K8U6_VESPE|nr:hypothetical protein H0235_015529 [Vespula pensylvanica]